VLHLAYESARAALFFMNREDYPAEQAIVFAEFVQWILMSFEQGSPKLGIRSSERAVSLDKRFPPQREEGSM
jgi:hypothetical protein